jgi:hypothetical protein
MGGTMTHPPNVCAHCENERNPVKKNNGFIFEFQIVDGVLMEICLHEGCMNLWCQAFNVRPQWPSLARHESTSVLSDSVH